MVSDAIRIGVTVLASTAVAATHALGSEAVVLTPNIFAPASTPAFAIRDLSWFVLGICAVIFMIVGGLLTYSIIRFRRRPGDEDREPPQVYGSNQIELAWTVVPVLIVVILFLATARYIFRFLGAHFFNTQAGGPAILWHHFFWFFGHTEVYVLMVPGFGFASEIIPAFSRKVIFGYAMVVASAVAIALVAMSTRAHHMFTVRLGGASNAFFAASTMLVAVPTGVKLNIIIALRHGGPAGDDPWDAWTLQWATTSPPPPYNFDAMPEVRSRRPL